MRNDSGKCHKWFISCKRYAPGSGNSNTDAAFFRERFFFVEMIVRAAASTRENGEECDEESINAVKTALMGPLAGIGDSFFWGTLRIIAAGIGASLAAQGSILGAVLFFLMYNIPQLFVRYQGLKLGYKSGVSFLENMSQGGVIALLTEVAKILGLVVVGSMCASMVALSTPLVISMDGADVVIQDIFNSILPNILPLGLTFVIYKLLQKGIKTTTVLWGIILFGIAGSVVGIF